jgi:single-stranded DNA-specific DHH superfamily exonuclease
MLAPTASVDCAIDFAKITDELMAEIDLLESFGQGNTVPAFVSHNHNIHSSGNKIFQGKHRKMFLVGGAMPYRPYIWLYGCFEVLIMERYHMP